MKIHNIFLNKYLKLVTPCLLCVNNIINKIQIILKRFNCSVVFIKSFSLGELIWDCIFV